MDEKSPQIRLAQPRGTVLTNMPVAALIIAALYFGREIFVPVALAVLLSFVLAPFVVLLHSWQIPRTASVLVVVFIGFSIIFSLGGLMVSQATRLAAKLPGYQQTLSDKIESLRGLMGGSGPLEQASTVLKELKTELQDRDAAVLPFAVIAAALREVRPSLPQQRGVGGDRHQPADIARRRSASRSSYREGVPRCTRLA